MQNLYATDHYFHCSNSKTNPYILNLYGTIGTIILQSSNYNNESRKTKFFNISNKPMLISLLTSIRVYNSKVINHLTGSAWGNFKSPATCCATMSVLLYLKLWLRNGAQTCSFSCFISKDEEAHCCGAKLNL